MERIISIVLIKLTITLIKFPMLKFNLLSFHSIKTYMEMYGVFTLLPFISLIILRRSNPYLKRWFWAVIPLWFTVHFFLVVAYQSRLFLVPTFLIFLPMILEYIEMNSNHGKKELLGLLGHVNKLNN